jgi:hypothetical protein
MAYVLIALGVAIFGIGMTLYFQAQMVLRPKKQEAFAKQFWWLGAVWMVLGLAAIAGGVVGLFSGII